MKPEDYTIERDAIVLRSPSANAVERARRGFMITFRQRPRISVRGLFPPGSVKDYPEEEINLLNPPAAAVVVVGRLYLTITIPWAPLDRRMILPLRGRNVEVRLRLPAALAQEGSADR